MQIRYDFSKKPELLNFEKHIKHYAKHNSILELDVFLKSYRIASIVEGEFYNSFKTATSIYKLTRNNNAIIKSVIIDGVYVKDNIVDMLSLGEEIELIMRKEFKMPEYIEYINNILYTCYRADNLVNFL